MSSTDASAALPNNLAFEREVLGAAIIDDDARDLLTGRARPEHFYGNVNRALFEAISTAYGEGRKVDAGLLTRHMTREGTHYTLPENVGTIHEYIGTLVTNRCPAAAVAERLEDIKACYDARSVHAVSQKMALAALETEGDPLAVEDVINDATEAIAVLTENIVGHPWQAIGESIEDAATNEERQPHFSSGLRDVDSLIGGGFRPGQYVTIAARPGQGKSTLAWAIARHASIRDRAPGLFLSLEMNSGELAERYLSAEARVNLAHISTRELNERERERVVRAAEASRGAPLYTITPDVAHWPTIRSYIVSAHRRLGIKYVVLDYIQLLDFDSSVRSGTSREQFLGSVSRALKSLALSLGITIFVVAQLNRGPEQRQDGRPAVSDLRESGQLEQDADMVILIHMPQTYDPNTSRAGEADLIFGKHRGGQTGTVACSALLHYSTMCDMAHMSDDAGGGY